MNPGFWLTYIIRSLKRGGRRAIFALSCVAVGVTGVVALQIASLIVQHALTSDVRSANGGDISVSSQSSPLSTSDLAVFRRLQSEGRISAWTPVASIHATAVGAKHELVPFQVDVVSSPPYPLGGDPTFVSPSNGHVPDLLRHPRDVLVTAVLAQELSVRVGSRLVVNSVGGNGLPVLVRGITSESTLQHSAAMTIQRRDAASLSARAPEYTAVYVNTRSSWEGMVDSRLRRAFPAATIQTVSQALQVDKAQVHDFQQFMLLVGLLALMIAGIGTLNAMQSMLARRRLEVAMLKAMGFGQATLYGLFGGEALLIGLLGGLLGTAVGAGVSKIITDTLAGALAIQVTYVVDIGTLAAGVALGVGAALVFAVLPIVRAASFRPLELLREGTTAAWTGWARTAGMLVLVMVLFSVLAAWTLGDLTLAVELVGIAFAVFALLSGGFALAVGWLGKLGRPASITVGLGILAALVAVTVLTAVRVPSVAPIAALAAGLWAVTVVLPQDKLLALLIAVRTLSRRRTRASVTLVAFLAGVLAMSLTLTVAISLRNQINSALSAAGSGNLVAVTTPQDSSRIVETARSLPGLRSLSSVVIVTTSPAAINGRPLLSVIGPAPSSNAGDPGDDRTRPLAGLTGYNLRGGDRPRQIQLVAGRGLGPRDAGTNHVMVRAGLMEPPYRLNVGDRITLRETGTGATKTVKVIGFYTRTRGFRFASFFSPPIYADRSLVISLAGSDAQSVVVLSVLPSHLAADATTLQRAVPGALVVDIGDLAAIVEQILNELLDILAVITALVLGAGVAVVANGVALAMMERRREIALFKAIGFGPADVMRFVLIENTLVGILAGAVSVLALAVALALLSHFALQRAVGFDPVVAILVLIAAALLAVITAYLSARAPVRVRPLEALRNE